MNEILELRKIFAFLTYGRIKPTPIESFQPSWVFSKETGYGVAIQVIDDLQIEEKFADINYYTLTLNVQGEDRNLLILESSNEKYRDQFASICCNFLYKGLLDEERVRNQKDPFRWWDSLKDLIGNVKSEKSVHAVIGELLTFNYLLRKNRNVQWNGATGSTVDIYTKEADYEVKSTTKRYDAFIEISSKYQLVKHKEKALNLVFCRFEHSDDGICINEIVEHLIKNGADATELEKNLSRVGLYAASRDRNKKYKILEVFIYNVDENFPVITDETFKDNRLPNHILKMTYTVDLTGLDCEKISLSI